MFAADDMRHAEELRCAAYKVALFERQSRIGTEDRSSGKAQWTAGALMVLETHPSSAVALPVIGLRCRVRWACPELVRELDSRNLFVV